MRAVREDDVLELLDRCAAGGPDEAGGVVAIGPDGHAALSLQFLPVRRETPLLAPGLPVAIVFDTSREALAEPAARLRLTPGCSHFVLDIRARIR